MSLVKICGITNVEDALAAIELGADFLGFNFYSRSPRFLNYEAAREVFQEVPGNIPKVGVFVNEDLTDVLDLAIEFDLDYLQFHGDEAPEALNELGRPWFKALRLKDATVVDSIPLYHCDEILLDAYSENAYGGTGKVLQWDLVREAGRWGKKIILAGGLHEDNVAASIAELKPWMVDVASGVESEPGIKDYEKMKRFIERAKQA